jgi:hypothetical protein
MILGVLALRLQSVHKSFVLVMDKFI